MVVMDGLVTILGGEDGLKFLPNVEQLRDGQWHLVDLPLLQPRSNFAAVVLREDLVERNLKHLLATCTGEAKVP